MIREQVLNALNQTWHLVRWRVCVLKCVLGVWPACNGVAVSGLIRAADVVAQEHFVCTDCSCSFPDMVFFERDGKPYCQDDYAKRFCEKYVQALMVNSGAGRQACVAPACGDCCLMAEYLLLQTGVLVAPSLCLKTAWSRWARRGMRNT